MSSAPPTLLSALRSLYVCISQNPADKGTIAPRAFIDKLKELNELFRSTMHQDAHEFLNYLLNQIVEEMDDDRKKLVNGHGHGSADGTQLASEGRE
jgi:ubiquitin carboxyl-terminal hydrolase 9/13